MTANCRIFLNVIATYGRSLYALVIGLFSSRWVLMVLGQEDFGLYGVIGGVVVFIGMINNLLSIALARFYAVSVGMAAVAENKDSAVCECRKWFSTAVFIHIVVPVLLMLIGYPIGEYVIRAGWIVVPEDKLMMCLWVFRFACCACFITMITIPFNAMYTAKQYIAELTVYNFAITTLNIVFFYYMVTHPGVWLAKYAAWMAAVSITPNLIIAFRAHILFPECRLIPREMLSLSRVLKLANFAGWQAFGGVGSVCRSQGLAILLNRYIEFGPMRNSSMSVANQIAGHTDMLSSSMIGALQPAIANAFGAKDYERMRSLSFCACKIGALFSLVFAIPLALELPKILSVWLKDPPVYATGLCFSILLAHIVDRMSAGHMLAVNAVGKIAMYQAFLGLALIFTLPLSYVFLKIGFGIYSVGWSIALMAVICTCGRVWFARTIVDMSATYWIKRILVPLIVLMIVTLIVGYFPHLIMEESLIRIIITTLFSEVALCIVAWFFVLNVSERKYVLERGAKLVKKYNAKKV